MTDPSAPHLTHSDLQLAFDLAPVGLCVSRNRIIQHCNEAFSSMFGYSPEELIGQRLCSLYPTEQEGERVGALAYPILRDSGRYSDERIMRHRNGQLFWCHVSGRTLDPDNPYDCAVWMFEDISAKRPVTAELTLREREVAKFLSTGMTSKEIARHLKISPRTVEAHRARLMKKLQVRTHTEMIARLVGLC
jgi:PAS domain S-box-containing protein